MRRPVRGADVSRYVYTLRDVGMTIAQEKDPAYAMHG